MALFNGLCPLWQCTQLTLNSLPLRIIRLRFRAAGVELSGEFAKLVLWLLFMLDPGDGAGGTYNEGRLTCRPDLVCVAVGVISDSWSELESPALITSPSSSSSSPRLRLLAPRLTPFAAACRGRGAIGTFRRLIVAVPAVLGVVTRDCICVCVCNWDDAVPPGFGARLIKPADCLI